MISGVAASLAAVAAFGGLGYYIGRDTATSETNFLEKQLEMFQSAEGANSLLEYLEDLSEYNDNLFEFSKHAEEIAQRETQIELLESENAQLSEEMVSVTEKLDRLTSEKSALEAEIVDLRESLALTYSVETEVTIREGESSTFFEGAFIVGVQNVYPSWTDVTILDERESLRVGEGFRFELYGNKCAIVPTKLDDSQDAATFSVTCQKAVE